MKQVFLDETYTCAVRFEVTTIKIQIPMSYNNPQKLILLLIVI